MTAKAPSAHDEGVRSVSVEQLAKEMPREAVFVTEHGRRIGTFRPLSGADESIPLDERKRRFLELAEKIGEQLAAQGVTEVEIERDFEGWKKARRRR